MKMSAHEGADLFAAVNRACRDLPDGWTIDLSLEFGAAWVSMCDADGNPVEFEETDRTLPERINEAVDVAINAATGEGRDV